MSRLPGIALIIAVLVFVVFPDLVERYQELLVGIGGFLAWYYHSRPRVVAHLRVSGSGLPIIDVENIGNRRAKNVVVELLPKEFVPRRTDREINREEPVGDMPPGYTREIKVPKSWYDVFEEDLKERERGRKDWEITVRRETLWKQQQRESYVFSLGTGSIMSDRALDNWTKTNDHLEKIRSGVESIGSQIDKLATLEEQHVHGDVLYLRVGQFIYPLSGPEFAFTLSGGQAKELIEAAESAMCPDGADSGSSCGHREEFVDRMKVFGGRHYFRWGVEDVTITDT